jgi:hypothetical protein
MSVWLFWIAIVLLLLLLSLWGLARAGFSCILCELFKPGKPEFDSDRAPPRTGSIRIPSDIYKRPDPLIYSQQFLSAHGLAVTWDNPDIWLEGVKPDGSRDGIAVPSNNLKIDTEYFVVARVWNGSVEAPAVNLPVEFSFLTFGIATVSTFIGTAHIDLPVKGAIGCPAFAAVKWHTPATPGHYCLQVKLIWPDDAEPGNNLGQENTDVVALNSPHAAFTFMVRNEFRERRMLRLTADFYRLHERPPCERQSDQIVAKPTREEARRQQERARSEHGRGKFAPPQGWTIKLLPEELALDAGEQQQVTVDVIAPDGFVGRQAINVNAFAGERLVGGVTLYVDGQ